MLPLNVVNEVLEQESNKTVEQWQQTRWLGTVNMRAMGADVKPTDLLKLPGDEKSTTKIDKETLKNLSKRGKL